METMDQKMDQSFILSGHGCIVHVLQPQYLKFKDRETSDMLTISGSYGDIYDGHDNPPKTTGVISDWAEVNQKLRHHGFQPVMVLPAERLDRLPSGAMVLEEYTSKHLRQTLESILADCDRRQALVQELISSSNRMQKEATEQAERVYHYEMQIRELQKELETEKVNVQEMEERRLDELHRHGEDLQSLQMTKADVTGVYQQLEQKCAKKDQEIARLQKRCHKLVHREEERLERQNRLFLHFKKRPPHKQNAVDQKVMDIIDTYEAKLDEMVEEIEHLRKEAMALNSSFIGSSGDIDVDRPLSEEAHPPSSEVSDEEVLPAEQAGDRRRDDSDMKFAGEKMVQPGQKNSREVAPKPLKGSAGKWRDDLEKTPGEYRTELKTLTQKLTSADKQMRDLKKLVKLLESENTHLKLELEGRPNRDEWKKTRKYNKQLERLLAQNNLSPPRKKHRDGGRYDEFEHRGHRRYSTHVSELDFLPVDVCREQLKGICSRLLVNDLNEIPQRLHSIEVMAETHPAMEKLIGDILDLTKTDDVIGLYPESLSESAAAHEVYCTRAWQNIVPTLHVWLKEIRALKDLQVAINKLSTDLMPWKPEKMFVSEDRRPVTVSRLKAAIEALSQGGRARPADIRGEGEPSVEQLKSVVAHFQRLFDVNSVAGVFPRMTEVYMRLGETYNATNTMRDLLALDPSCKVTDVVNAVGKLSKAKHLLKVDDLPGIIKRLHEYDEFIPTFQSMVKELCKMLGVDEMSEIVTAVRALIKFPHY